MSHRVFALWFALAACSGATPNSVPPVADASVPALSGSAEWTVMCPGGCLPSDNVLSVGTNTFARCSLTRTATGYSVSARIARVSTPGGVFEETNQGLGFDGTIPRSPASLVGGSDAILVRGNGWQVAAAPSATCSVRVAVDEGRRSVSGSFDCTAADDSIPPIPRTVRGSLMLLGCQ